MWLSRHFVGIVGGAGNLEMKSAIYQLLGIGRTNFVKNLIYVPRQTKATVSDSKHSKHKATPMAVQGAHSGARVPQRDPKGTQSRPQEGKRKYKDAQRIATNHKTVFTCTKYTQTTNPPPYVRSQPARLVQGVYLILGM